MKIDLKPALVVIGTLILGMILGALTLSVVMRHRMDRLHGMARPGGFKQSLIESVGKMDLAQRTAVEEEIRLSSLRIDSAMNAGRGQIDMMIDSMMIRLDSLLTPEQRARLHREIGKRPRGHGGPPFGKRPHGEPPPGGFPSPGRDEP